MSEPARLYRFECRVRSRKSLQIIEIISMTGPDKETVIAQLQRDGYLVVSVTESRSGKTTIASFQQGVSNLKKNKKLSIFSKKNVSTRELIFFAVQLSTLISAGVALVRALEILERGTSNLYFSQVIKQLT